MADIKISELLELVTPGDDDIIALVTDIGAGVLETKKATIANLFAELVDDTTIEKVAGAIRLKDGGVSTGKLANDVLSADATGRNKMADGFVNADKLDTDSVTTNKILNSNVTKAKIENSGANSVIGKSGSAGTPADISASSNGVLRRSGSGNLAFGTLVTANIGDDQVDDTKVGNRVPQFYRRQGGSSTNWDTHGSTNRTPTTVRIQAGVIRVTIPKSDGDPLNYDLGEETVTFPTSFSYSPIVWVSNQIHSYAGNPGQSIPPVYVSYVSNITDSGFDVTCRPGYRDGGSATYIPINWIAIGPE